MTNQWGNITHVLFTACIYFTSSVLLYFDADLHYKVRNLTVCRQTSWDKRVYTADVPPAEPKIQKHLLTFDSDTIDMALWNAISHGCIRFPLCVLKRASWRSYIYEIHSKTEPSEPQWSYSLVVFWTFSHQGFKLESLSHIFRGSDVFKHSKCYLK